MKLALVWTRDLAPAPHPKARLVAWPFSVWVGNLNRASAPYGWYVPEDGE